MIPDFLLRWFPKLNVYTTDLIEDVNPKYNCIAFTIGSRSFRMWPIDIRPLEIISPEIRIFWPTELPNDDSLDNFIEMYKIFGYELCDNEKFEKDYRKIAIFCRKDTNIVTHAALQNRSGIWTSKLGDSYGISHMLRDLEGQKYGEVRCFVRRPITITKEFDFKVLGRYLN